MNPPPSTSPASRPEGETVAAVTVLTSRGVRELRPADALRSYDFRQSGFLAPSELRRLRMRHEQFVRGLAGRLAMFVRGEFFLRLADLQIVAYQKLTENLPGPTHITLFKVEPLKGTGLLLIPPHLGLSLVDRLLGGSGRTTEPVRDLSEIEVALIVQVADLVRSLAGNARAAPVSHRPRKPQPLSPDRRPGHGHARADPRRRECGTTGTRSTGFALRHH
jgi:flagellar motor switch protein FliM